MEVVLDKTPFYAESGGQVCVLSGREVVGARTATIRGRGQGVGGGMWLDSELNRTEFSDHGLLTVLGSDTSQLGFRGAIYIALVRSTTCAFLQTSSTHILVTMVCQWCWAPTLPSWVFAVQPASLRYTEAAPHTLHTPRLLTTVC